MRKNSVKNIRINGEVQKALSEIIRSELKDPRVHPMTSVVQVSVTQFGECELEGNLAETGG